MSKQEFVAKSTGPRFVGDTFPAAAENGDTFLYTVSNPKSLYVWDGNPGAGRWIFWGYLREVNYAPGSAGYFLGGDLGGGAAVTNISKIIFTSESASQLSTGLPAGQTGGGGVRSMDAGYYISGYTNMSATVTTKINKLVFSGDTVSSLTTGLGTAQGEPASFESAEKGYVAGGDTTGSPTLTPTSSISALLFSAETVSTITSTTSSARYSIMGGFASAVAGYLAGGVLSGGTTYVSNVDKLTFSSESTSLLSSGTSVLRGHMAGCNSLSKGYAISGGDNSSAKTTIDRVTFATDAVNAITSGLATGRFDPAGCQSFTAGYIGGGNSGGVLSLLDRLMFSTEATSTLASNLSVSRTDTVAFENTN